MVVIGIVLAVVVITIVVFGLVRAGDDSHRCDEQMAKEKAKAAKAQAIVESQRLLNERNDKRAQIISLYGGLLSHADPHAVEYIKLQRDSILHDIECEYDQKISSVVGAKHRKEEAGRCKTTDKLSRKSGAKKHAS